MLPRNNIAIYKFSPGSFHKYRNMYPHFQKWQEFALDGGVSFGILTNSDGLHTGWAFISELKSQHEFNFRNEKRFADESGLFKKHVSQIVTKCKFLTLNASIATKVVCVSRLLKCLRSLYGKQCGPRSDCSHRCSLFWVHAVCFYT